MRKAMIKIISESVAKLRTCRSEDHVLVKFEEEIHCEIVNKDDENVII